MSFQADLQADFATVFCDPTEFGENIVYTAKRKDYIEATAAPASGEKTIPARVIRDDPNPNRKINGEETANPFPINGVQFYISKDATNGISLVNTSLDKVQIPVRIGETASLMRVTKILEENAFLYFLQAEK